MERKFGLSQAEYEIMELFWSAEKPLSFKEVLQYFNNEKGREWKKQTVSSFLKILQDKNLIEADASQTKYTYRAIYTKDEHVHLWTQRLIEDLFDNSVGKFLVAFSGGEKLSEMDARELREYLKAHEEQMQE